MVCPKEKQCVVHPSSAQKIALLMGGTLKNRSSWFSAHFQCFVTCSLLQAMRPEMLALLQIRSRCCGTLTVQQSKCLALLSITPSPKTLHEVSTN